KVPRSCTRLDAFRELANGPTPRAVTDFMAHRNDNRDWPLDHLEHRHQSETGEPRELLDAMVLAGASATLRTLPAHAAWRSRGLPTRWPGRLHRSGSRPSCSDRRHAAQRTTDTDGGGGQGSTTILTSEPAPRCGRGGAREEESRASVARKASPPRG